MRRGCWVEKDEVVKLGGFVTFTEGEVGKGDVDGGNCGIVDVWISSGFGLAWVGLGFYGTGEQGNRRKEKGNRANKKEKQN